MLESEAMAILVGAGVSYGRRKRLCARQGSALAILAEPGLYAAQLQGKGLALSGTRVDGWARCWAAWEKGDGACSRAGTNIIRRASPHCAPAAPALCLWADGFDGSISVAVVGTRAPALTD